MDEIQEIKKVAQFMGWSVDSSPSTEEWPDGFRKCFLISIFDGKRSHPFKITENAVDIERLIESAWSEICRSLNYKGNWSDLMPVVEKISQTVIKGHEPFNSDQFVRVEIIPNGYVKISNLRDTPIFANVSSSGSFIAAVWLAVTAFLEWLNTQNKNGN